LTDGFSSPYRDQPVAEFKDPNDLAETYSPFDEVWL